MTQFEGKFTNSKNENLEEFYSAIGVPWIPRKLTMLIDSSSPTMEITNSEGTWTITTTTMIHTSTASFKMGEEFYETMHRRGRQCKRITKIEGNKMITDSEEERGTSKRVMEFNKEGFVMTLNHDKTDLVAKRTFTRVVE